MATNRVITNPFLLSSGDPDLSLELRRVAIKEEIFNPEPSFFTIVPETPAAEIAAAETAAAPAPVGNTYTAAPPVRVHWKDQVDDNTWGPTPTFPVSSPRTRSEAPERHSMSDGHRAASYIGPRLGVERLA